MSPVIHQIQLKVVAHKAEELFFVKCPCYIDLYIALITSVLISWERGLTFFSYF